MGGRQGKQTYYKRNKELGSWGDKLRIFLNYSDEVDKIANPRPDVFLLGIFPRGDSPYIAFPSTSCCKLCICFILQACHVKISKNSLCLHCHLPVCREICWFISFSHFQRAMQAVSRGTEIIATTSVTAWTYMQCSVKRGNWPDQGHFW